MFIESTFLNTRQAYMPVVTDRDVKCWQCLSMDEDHALVAEYESVLSVSEYQASRVEPGAPVKLCGECYDACMDVEYVRVSIKPAGFLGTQKEQGAHAEPDGPSPIIFVHAFDESRAQTVADFRSGSDIWTELHGDTLDPIADIVPAGMTSWVHEIIEEEIQKEGV